MGRLILALIFLLAPLHAMAAILFEVEDSTTGELVKNTDILKAAKDAGRRAVIYITWSDRYCNNGCVSLDVIDSFDDMVRSGKVDLVVINIDKPDHWETLKSNKLQRSEKRWPNSRITHSSKNSDIPFGGYFNTSDWPVLYMQDVNGALFHMRASSEAQAGDYFQWWGEEFYWNSPRSLNSIAWNYYTQHRKHAPVASSDELYQTMLKLVKRSVALEPNYNNLDTLAALLFLGGDYTAALKQAKKAIDYAKSAGEEYDSTSSLIEDIIAEL